MGEFSHDRDARAPDSIAENQDIARVYPCAECTPGSISIGLLNDELDEWNTYVSKNAAASLYHRAEWRNLIRDSFGHESFYFMARNESQGITGILPLVRLRSRLFGDYMVSMPYFNYGGAIADHQVIEQQLMNVANEHAGKLGIAHIEYRDDIPRPGLPERSDKVSMILPLPDSDEILWNGFTSKLRSQIRRPLKENPTIVSAGKDCLDDFYAVFSRNMRDLGTPVYSKEFFMSILDYFPQESGIIVVLLDRKPVAAAFLIGHGDTLEIPWASAIRDVNKLSINMLLYWEVLKTAIKSGYSRFDFGRSSKDSGTYRLKRQWGATPVQLHWHYWIRDNGELPNLNPSNPKYAPLISIWKRLPLSVTRLLGPMIVKNLP